MDERDRATAPTRKRSRFAKSFELGRSSDEIQSACGSPCEGADQRCALQRGETMADLVARGTKLRSSQNAKPEEAAKDLRSSKGG